MILSRKSIAVCSHGAVGRPGRAASNGVNAPPAFAKLRHGRQGRGYRERFTLPKQRGPESVRGFTLAELLVSVGVLALLVLLFTQLVNSAATITTLGHKRMDADSEARQVFDRMAIDFAQMVKRSDVDYFAKNTAAPNSVGGPMFSSNDQIAFYSSVPGYYPASSNQSPVSLVAYRVNSDSNSSSYNKLERLGKGLVWNGASTTDTPVVFMPLTISATWPAATSSSAPDTTAYEVIGPDVFRFEYYYLVTTATAPFLTDLPCTGGGCTVNGFRQVAAIVVDIAVIDPRSKVLLNPSGSDIATLNGNSASTNFLKDFPSDPNPGKTLTIWQTKLNQITTLPNPFPSGVSPRQTVSGIRVYERYFYLPQ
jgi:hypothetical protein